jgi:beta-aspartyl-peptidase (threonine type)
MFLVLLAMPQAANAGWLLHRCRPCCVVVPDCAPAAQAEPEDAIKQVLNDQVAAWNKGDLEGFMKGYWKSADLTFFSGNDKTAGWQATMDRYVKKYRSDGKEMGQLTFSELKVEVLGPDSAFVRGRFQLEMGKEKPTGLFTLIFKRTPDGWRIIHDHTSG